MRSINPKLNITQPALLQLFALTVYVYVAMATGPLVPAARAGAITNASGGGADVDMPKSLDDPHSNGLAAEASKSDSGTNGSWSAFAEAIGPIAEAPNVTLRASATASWKGAASHQNPSATAFAQWSDQLMIENPDVLDARTITAFFVIFRPSVRGTISGNGSSAHFQVIADGQVQSADFPGFADDHLNFLIPAADLQIGLVYFTMTLTASASTLAIPAPYFSEADFSHTAVLPQLILADANGNYVPGTEQLRIVGTSGLEYSVAAVPEPSMFVLAALGILGLGLVALRKKYHRVRCSTAV